VIPIFGPAFFLDPYPTAPVENAFRLLLQFTCDLASPFFPLVFSVLRLRRFTFYPGYRGGCIFYDPPSLSCFFNFSLFFLEAVSSGFSENDEQQLQSMFPMSCRVHIVLGFLYLPPFREPPLTGIFSIDLAFRYVARPNLPFRTGPFDHSPSVSYVPPFVLLFVPSLPHSFPRPPLALGSLTFSPVASMIEVFVPPLAHVHAKDQSFFKFWATCFFKTSPFLCVDPGFSM